MRSSLQRASSGFAKGVGGLRQRLRSTVAFEAATERVDEAIAKYSRAHSNDDDDRSRPCSSSIAAVPTEFLGADGNATLVDRSRPPRCCAPLIARRPCLVVLLTIFACLLAGVGLVLFGELNLSVQAELFADAGHPDVQADLTSKQLPYIDAQRARTFMVTDDGRRLSPVTTDSELSQAAQVAEAADGGLDEARSQGVRELTRRQLPEATPEPARRRASVALPSEKACREQGGRLYHTIVYEARDGKSMLGPRELQAALLVEERVRQWAAEVGACGDYRQHKHVHCAPLDSALNYFFPSVVEGDDEWFWPAAKALGWFHGGEEPDGSANGVRFDGRGLGNDTTLMQAGITCEPALAVDDVEGVHHRATHTHNARIPSALGARCTSQASAL